MLALELEKIAVKEFMGKLLRENLFDGFELRTAEIFTNTRITIDGASETGEFATWGAVRPLVYEVIKLCSKPRLVKIIFSRANATEIHTNAAAVFLNMVYENDGVTFTTATAQKEFALDKSLDAAWDTVMREFFDRENIAVADRE